MQFSSNLHQELAHLILAFPLVWFRQYLTPQATPSSPKEIDGRCFSKHGFTGFQQLSLEVRVLVEFCHQPTAHHFNSHIILQCNWSSNRCSLCWKFCKFCSVCQVWFVRKFTFSHCVVMLVGWINLPTHFNWTQVIV